MNDRDWDGPAPPEGESQPPHSEADQAALVLAETLSDLERANTLLTIRRQELGSIEVLRRDRNRIAVYLRTHYAPEIADGQHRGMDFADTIIHYLHRERTASRKLSSLAGRLSLLFIRDLD